MTSKQHAVLIDQDRCCEPKGANAVCDLGDLLVRMGSRAVGIRFDLVDGDHFGVQSNRIALGRIHVGAPMTCGAAK